MSKVVISASIEKFKKEEWNALNIDHNPFVSWEFYKALESGNCVGPESGWNPLFFAALDGEDHLQAVIPLYLKTDSYGEFIFDWEWARAYQQHGLNYYPKLTAAVPYSPISAPKLLGPHSIHRETLLPQVFDFYQKQNISGLHFLFTNKEEDSLLKEFDLMERDSVQYHWNREEVNSFDDFLASHKKSKRKTIKRERREIGASDLEIKTFEGKDISIQQIEFFYECYLTTIDKKWSQAYLSLDFFKSFIQNRPDAVSLIIASLEETPIASSLYLHSQTTLYGRYWGAVKNINFLHFEMCIYQGIDLCIQKGLQKFEAGAQGEHKRMRGFAPTLTKSAHHIRHPDFSKAIERFLGQESQALHDYVNNA